MVFCTCLISYFHTTECIIMFYCFLFLWSYNNIIFSIEHCSMQNGQELPSEPGQHLWWELHILLEGFLCLGLSDRQPRSSREQRSSHCQQHPGQRYTHTHTDTHCKHFSIIFYLRNSFIHLPSRNYVFVIKPCPSTFHLSSTNVKSWKGT